jgi:hypothetical protein
MFKREPPKAELWDLKEKDGVLFSSIFFFVNMTAMSNLLSDLESQGDPMTTLTFAWNMHEWNGIFYPQGGTGWLFSNFAVRFFVDHLQRFLEHCEMTADDIALTTFLKENGMDSMKWQTNKFIVTWPNQQLDVIFKRKYEVVDVCPEFYYLVGGNPKGLVPGRARSAASIHMHRVPMNRAWEVLCETPVEFAVTFRDPNTPIFCRIRE